jgi:hypothetical protein
MTPEVAEAAADAATKSSVAVNITAERVRISKRCDFDGLERGLFEVDWALLVVGSTN